MYWNGVRIIGMAIMKARQRMEEPGRQEVTKIIQHCGAARGTSILTSAVLLTASTLSGGATTSALLSVFEL